MTTERSTYFSVWAIYIIVGVGVVKSVGAVRVVRIDFLSEIGRVAHYG